MYLKGLILIICSLLLFADVHAQASGSAGQTVTLNLSPIIDVSFLNVNIDNQSVPNFTSKGTINKGADCGFRVKANKPFTISVQHGNATSQYNNAGLSITGDAIYSGSNDIHARISAKTDKSQTLIAQSGPCNDGRFFIAYHSAMKKSNNQAEHTPASVIYTATLP